MGQTQETRPDTFLSDLSAPSAHGRLVCSGEWSPWQVYHVPAHCKADLPLQGSHTVTGWSMTLRVQEPVSAGSGKGCDRVVGGGEASSHF